MQKIIVSSIAAAVLALSGSAAWADMPDQHNPDNPIVMRRQMHDWQHRQARHHGVRYHHDYHHHHMWRHRHAM